LKALAIFKSYRITSIVFGLTLQVALSSAGCRYFFSSIWPEQGYACEYSGARTTHDSDTLDFIGDHIGSRTNLNVTVLRFINSRLDTLPANLFKEFPNLTQLQANNVHLKRLNERSLAGCPRVMLYLELANNSISRLDDGVISCTNILEINLSSNHINRIGANVFERSRELTRIYLNNNRLTQIPTNLFSNFERLNQLDLSFNEISDLAPDSFRNFGNARSFAGMLLLGHNKLERLSSNIFGRTTSYVGTFDASFNQINAIQSSFFNLFHEGNTVKNDYLLQGNECVDADFRRTSKVDLNKQLERCILNY
jgi:Leucine-rich repeat (LRR) protein